MSFNVLLSINLIIPALENETKMKLKIKILQQQDVRYHFLSSVDQCGTENESPCLCFPLAGETEEVVACPVLWQRDETEAAVY